MPETSYDRVPYPTGTFDQTHPSRLATLATLFGMSPTPVERCRVLELACGRGGNLLPMAEALPGSTFTGIDLAAQPIAEAEARAKALGLDNLTFRCGDILELDPEPESYDYIIAHGVYSWVPPAVQEKILAVVRRALSAHGVAYVSYNALPGGYLRRIIRDMMFFHTREITEPQRRVAQGRAVVGFVANSSLETAGTYKRVMEAQRDRIARLSDNYLFHDDLGDDNEALYFHEFMARATRHELQYLAESEYAEMQDQMFPPEVQRALAGAGDLLTHEQYLDFLCGRTFRRTLLVRAEVELQRTLTGASARPFFVHAGAAPVSKEPDLLSDAVERFENPSGLAMGLDSPLAKAAMTLLHERRPLAFTFDELLAAVRARLGDDRPDAGEAEAQELGELLLGVYGGDMVQLQAYRPAMVARPGEAPRARSLARAQAALGPDVTSLWHVNVKMDDPIAQRVLALLDGTRDRAALIAALGGEVSAEKLEEVLERMGRMALLEA